MNEKDELLYMEVSQWQTFRIFLNLGFGEGSGTSAFFVSKLTLNSTPVGFTFLKKLRSFLSGPAVRENTRLPVYIRISCLLCPTNLPKGQSVHFKQLNNISSFLVEI